MEALPHPDALFLSAAQGWLELGNSAEAAAELERIDPSLRDRPEVLEVGWQIVVKAKDWSQGLSIAERICELAPDVAFGWIHRSYCLHELKRTQEAWDILLPMAQKFPQEWLICYNLACYACQLGNMDAARQWLARAADLGDSAEVNQLAVKDEDLKPLFNRSS